MSPATDQTSTSPLAKVIAAGVHTLLQDYGRIGGLAQGYSRGGPVDGYAFLWANRLLGQAYNTSQLEVLFGGLELELLAATAIVVTGAPVRLTINDEDKPQWQVPADKPVLLGTMWWYCWESR